MGARGNEEWGGTTMRRERNERLAVGPTVRREERTNRVEGVRRPMSGARSGPEEEENGSEMRLTVSCGCGQRAEDGCERTSVGTERREKGNHRAQTARTAAVRGTVERQEETELRERGGR